jgi:hypothetical protein
MPQTSEKPIKVIEAPKLKQESFLSKSKKQDISLELNNLTGNNLIDCARKLCEVYSYETVLEILKASHKDQFLEHLSAFKTLFTLRNLDYIVINFAGSSAYVSYVAGHLETIAVVLEPSALKKVQTELVNAGYDPVTGEWVSQ